MVFEIFLQLQQCKRSNTWLSFAQRSPVCKYLRNVATLADVCVHAYKDLLTDQWTLSATMVDKVAIKNALRLRTFTLGGIMHSACG